jgi:hypothetical protein
MARLMSELDRMVSSRQGVYDDTCYISSIFADEHYLLLVPPKPVALLVSPRLLGPTPRSSSPLSHLLS